MNYPPRLRVFAGPNGSGKSTIIRAVNENKYQGRLLNLGIYINADDIARCLREEDFKFSTYELTADQASLESYADGSGLLSEEFTADQFVNCFRLDGNRLFLTQGEHCERLAQILARYLRQRLLTLNSTFSFETVFSHVSNIDLMKQAVEAGYKVYLYMVCTSSPEINKYRVALRVQENGHSVPPDRIESRYYRSLDLMYEAAQLCHQAWFFDNSLDGQPFRLIAHFRKNGKEKIWDDMDGKEIPNWFHHYYIKKVPKER